MIDQQIDIATKDGKTTTFITHPERGGPFPVIIFYMDAPAIREELRDMARRLGTSGYYVMLPNMYYRSGVMEIGPIPPDPEGPSATDVRLHELDQHSHGDGGYQGPARLCRDARSGKHENRRHRRLLHERPLRRQCGSTHFPDRVKAAASIYGTHLATDQPDSPHLAASKTKVKKSRAPRPTSMRGRRLSTRSRPA